MSFRRILHFFFIAAVHKEDTGLLLLPLWMVSYAWLYIQDAGIDNCFSFFKVYLVSNNLAEL